MTLAFIKYYNPAYGFLVFRYLAEGGIKLAPNVSFSEAVRMANALDKKRELSPYQRALCNYVEAWKENPERRPSGKMLLEGLYEIEPGTSELSRLQGALPPEAGRLVLTKDDVAMEIVEFYRQYLGESLRKDLKTGVLKELYVYVEPNDDSRLDRARRFGPARYEDEVKRFCQELLSSFAGVTRKVVLDNIDIVFEEHFCEREHMRRPSWYHGPSQTLVCRHGTQLVTLSGIASQLNGAVRLTLVPTRGDPLCHARGDVPSFPWYDVIGMP